VGIQAVRHQRDPEGLRKLAGNPPEKWDPVWSGTTFRYLGNAPSRQGLIFMFGYGLERGQRQVDSDAPFLHRYLGIGDWRIGLDAEIGLVACVPVRHLLVAGFDGMLRSAMRADSPFRPDDAFKPLYGYLLVWKHCEKINMRKPFAVVTDGFFGDLHGHFPYFNDES